MLAIGHGTCSLSHSLNSCCSAPFLVDIVCSDSFFFFGAVDVLLRRNDSVSLVLCIVASYISGMSLWVISHVIITTNVVSRFMHLTRMF